MNPKTVALVIVALAVLCWAGVRQHRYEKRLEMARATDQILRGKPCVSIRWMSPPEL